MTKLMNKENDWNLHTLCKVKEGPVDCIRVGEAIKALENRKKTGLSGVVTEMLQATGELAVSRHTEGKSPCGRQHLTFLG